MENLTEGLENLTQEQQQALIAKLEQAVSETKSRFMGEVVRDSLRQRYDAEVATIPSYLSHNAKIRRLTAVKRKYRALGLEVW